MNLHYNKTSSLLSERQFTPLSVVSNAFQMRREITSSHCRWVGEAGLHVLQLVVGESKYVPDTETLSPSRHSERRRRRSRSATLNSVIKWKLHGQSGDHGMTAAQHVEEGPESGFGTARSPGFPLPGLAVLVNDTQWNSATLRNVPNKVCIYT